MERQDAGVVISRTTKKRKINARELRRERNAWRLKSKEGLKSGGNAMPGKGTRRMPKKRSGLSCQWLESARNGGVGEGRKS